MPNILRSERQFRLKIQINIVSNETIEEIDTILESAQEGQVFEKVEKVFLLNLVVERFTKF